RLRAGGERDPLGAAAAIDLQHHLAADRQLGDAPLQRRHVHRLRRIHVDAVQAEDAVAGTQPGLLRLGAALDGIDQHAAVVAGALERAQAEAEVSAFYATV